MVTHLVVILAILLSAVSQLCGPTAARAEDMNCSGLIAGGRSVTNIDVTVPEVKSCVLSFVNVKADVWVGRDATVVVSEYMDRKRKYSSGQGTSCFTRHSV
jgi:hypothetical protein